MAAVEAIYRQLREWPPNGAQIRAKVLELTLDAPDFGEACAAIRRCASYSDRLYHAGEIRDRRAEELAGEHPLVQEFVKFVGWREAVNVNSDDRVAQAQARTRYEQFLHRVERTAQLQGLAPAAGLPALERAANAPRRLSAAALLEAIPGGGQEANAA